MVDEALHRPSVKPRNILIIEDDKDIAGLLELHLHDGGYDVHVVSDGVTGLKHALANAYDLIILDLMLPGMEGLDVCRHVRTKPNYTPILMLTAKSTELDRVLGLEVGADDYLTKPFSIRELLARVKALFRRMEALAAQRASDKQPMIQVGDLVIDTEKRKVTLYGNVVDLTAKEFDLLLQFAQHPGRVYTRSQLLDLVWGYSHAGYEHTVNSHINRLRAKIERDTSYPRYILTVWGIGYSFSEEHSRE
ncbi:MAG: response regulator transcription factor [Nitrospira sp.]|nr:response regulator transcription factor [Nitrospira sp.]